MADLLFKGFTKETIQFFSDLKQNNDKAWFEEHRQDFNDFVLEPAKQFVLDMGGMLQQLRPDIYFEPKIDKSIFRIHRDVRFSKNKLPYKTHLAFLFWEGNKKKLENPGFYFHFEPDEIIIANGLYTFSPSALKAYRDAVVSEKFGPSLEIAIKELESNGLNIGEPHYKKVPRGYGPDHPRANLLKYNGMGTMIKGPLPEDIFSEDLIYYCFEKYKKMLSIHDWLVQFNSSF